MNQPLLIRIKPKPSPRPRWSSKIQKMHMPSWYQPYKNELIRQIKEAGIPPASYSALFVTFGMPYPKQVKGGKKAKIEGKPHQANSGDADNLIKTLKDAIEESGVIHNDCQIYYEITVKVWTCTAGYIEFFML